jgi:hypothetical protein
VTDGRTSSAIFFPEKGIGIRDTLFNIVRREVGYFIVIRERLHLGTLYVSYFELLFHRRIAKQGYSGGIRKLNTSREMQSMLANEAIFGILVDNLDISKYTIPRMKRNSFFISEANHCRLL